MQAEFEDTKGIIRIRKSKNRQHNCQMKKDKRTSNDLQTYTWNYRSSNTNPAKDRGVNEDAVDTNNLRGNAIYNNMLQAPLIQTYILSYTY